MMSEEDQGQLSEEDREIAHLAELRNAINDHLANWNTGDALVVNGFVQAFGLDWLAIIDKRLDKLEMIRYESRFVTVKEMLICAEKNKQEMEERFKTILRSTDQPKTS